MATLSNRLSIARYSWLFSIAGILLLIVICPDTCASGQEVIRIPGTNQLSANHPLPEQSLLKDAKTTRASLPHLYWHFLLYQNYLDRAAAIREQQGKDGVALRNHFQKKLGFANSQFDMVRAAGLHLEVNLKPINDKVRLIAKQDSEWRKMAGASVRVPPPGHAQMQELRREHEAVIEAQVAELNRALGANYAATLQTFIETEWAPHVTVHQLHLIHPRPHDPKNYPPKPLHMEARQ